MENSQMVTKTVSEGIAVVFWCAVFFKTHLQESHWTSLWRSKIGAAWETNIVIQGDKENELLRVTQSDKKGC